MALISDELALDAMSVVDGRPVEKELVLISGEVVYDDPMRQSPAPMASTLPPDRVNSLTWT